MKIYLGNIRNYIFSAWVVFCSMLFLSCGKSDKKPESIKLISDITEQDLVFKNLVEVTGDAIPKSTMNDSLAFLIVPVQASCPACRKKTIDSIIKYQNNLAANHFIIISAKGGRKTIESYFREEDHEMPVMPDKLFLDSTNQAGKQKLYESNPAMYYSYKGKAYKKVYAIPATVKEDLHEFFSGHRNDTN